MANTYVDYTGNGSETDFNFSFPYIKTSHVAVEVNEGQGAGGLNKWVRKTLTTDYSVETSPATLVRFVTAPASNVKVRVLRDSNANEGIVDFANGSVLTETELDNSYQHNRYLAEEAEEGITGGSLSKNTDGQFDADALRLENLADPDSDDDAVNKGYADNRYVDVAGDTMTGNLDMGANKVTSSATPSSGNDLTNKTYTDDTFVDVAGDTMSGELNMGSNKITNLGTPTDELDAATKDYVDQTIDSSIALGGSPAIVSLGGYDVTTLGSTTARSLEDRFGDVVNVLDYGADNTGTVETSSHIQAAIDEANTGGKGVVYFPAGTYLVNTELNCAVGFPGSGLTLLGADGYQSVISCSSNIVVFRHVERFTAKRLRLVQTGGTIGAAFATPNYRVTTHALFEDLEISSFKFGLLWRYSTHNAVRNVRMYSVACGVRLARHADTITNIGDQTNPIAAGAWNQPTQNGWYHNQNTFDTMLFQGGEVGIWGSPHGNTFINITAQQQDGDGTSNVALPSGQEGTGFFLEGGGDNTVLTKRGWQNSLINCYTERCKQPIVVRDLRGLTIDGFFAQGGLLGNKYTNFIDAENSTLHLANCTGLDYFTNCLKVTNCKVDSRTSLPGSGGILYLRNSNYVSDRNPTTGAIDVDSDSYFNPYGVNPGLQTNIEFSFANGTTADGQTLTVIPSLERECHYTVHVLTLRAGAAPVRTAKFDVYNYGFYTPTLFNTIRADSTNDPAISVAVVNNTTLELTITDAGNVAWNGAIQVVNTRRLGSYPFTEDLNNNPPQNPGV